MRAALHVAACWSLASVASGQPLSASGGVGVGVVVDSPATVVEAGADYTSATWQVGIGGRVAVLADGELRREDWDTPSEWATVLRYLSYQRPAFDDEWQLAVAVGELGGATLGHGSLIGEYASGIDIDHRHLGAQVRAAGRQFGGEALIDDLVAPRLLGGRGHLRVVDSLHVAAALTTDLSAPSMMGADAVVGTSVDAVWSWRRVGRPWWAEAFGGAATWWGLGTGLHLGGRGTAELGGVTVSARGELFAGTGSYMHGMVGALYERHRRQVGDGVTLLDRVREGGLEGAGARSQLSLARTGLGQLSGWIGHRPGLGTTAGGRLAAAEYSNLQLAVTGAYDRMGSDPAALWAAAEARVRLPARLFGRVQLARLYRGMDERSIPVWWAIATIGAVLGE